MPTIYREAGYRVYFYVQDHTPAHVHIGKDGAEAKFEISPVRLIWNDGFRPRDLSRIEFMVRAHAREFEDAWHGHFRTKA